MTAEQLSALREQAKTSPLALAALARVREQEHPVRAMFTDYPIHSPLYARLLAEANDGQ